MFEQKLNNQQDKSKNVFQKAIFIISNTQLYKQRKDLVKIIYSALNVCANIFLVTRIRLPQLGNICTNSNYDPQYGCNSVFNNLLEKEAYRTNWQDNQSEMIDQNVDSSQILTFAENQVQIDSQSILNILRIAAPLYLIVFLCSNIAELASKKSKIDILVFILVLITVSDLLLFNSAYSFSTIKPNRQDSQLFSQHFTQFNQLSLSRHDQASLLQAQNDIFLQVNKFIIAFAMVTRIAAIMITAFKFSNNIESLCAIKAIQKKIQQLRKTSAKISTQSNTNNSKQAVIQVKHTISSQNTSNQKGNNNAVQQTKIVGSKNSSKVQNPSAQQKRSSILENGNNTRDQGAKMNQEQMKDLNKINNTPSITPSTKSCSNQASSNNKKTKNMNKKQLKNQTKPNFKSDIQSQIISKDKQKEQSLEENQNKIDADSECYSLMKECEEIEESDACCQQTQIGVSISEEAERNDVEQEEQTSTFTQNLNSINRPELQDNKQSLPNQIATSDKTNVQNQNFSKIQKLNSQISLDTDEDQRIIKTKPLPSEVFAKEDNKSINIHWSSAKSPESASPQLQSTSISPSLDSTTINNYTNQISSPQTISTARQNSYEASDFSLNESTQTPIESISSNTQNISPIISQIINPIPRIVILNQQPSEQESTNQNCGGEQIVIEQVNEELRKKWMLKQKAMKLEKKKANQTANNLTSNSSIADASNNYGSTNANAHNSSQFSQLDNNTSYSHGGNSYIQNNHFLSTDQQILQEDLDISTNDESNFTSINSNYDAQSITKQNYHPMNLKNLSQHLMNQQVSQALTQQQQYQQQLQGQDEQMRKLQQNGDYSISHSDNQDISAYYQNYQNQQYQEEQCYSEDHVSRTTNPRTRDQTNLGSKQSQYFEDNYQDPSQKCFEQFIRLNQQNNQNLLKQQNGRSNVMYNCPQQQQNNAFGFNYEDDDEECGNIEGKTPFEIFYDQQCMMDEDYDEEEELDQFQENMEDEDDDEDEEEDDEDEEDDDDEDDDDEEDISTTSLKHYKLQATAMANINKSIQGKSYQELIDMGYTQEQIKYICQINSNGCNVNQEGLETNSDNSAFLHSHLHQTTEIFSVDELKSHLGDYLDLINDNSLLHHGNQDFNPKKFDLSQLNTYQQLNQSLIDAAAEDGKKKKKKKKKSKEQKRKRRCKRKLKKKLERSMIDYDLQGPITLESTQTQQTTQISQSNNSNAINNNNINLNTTNSGNRKKNQKHKKNNKNKKNLNNDYSANIDDMYSTQMQNGYLTYSGYSLKRLLDENLLEYFTFTVVLSQGMSVNIYITDFYQFDEQFEMQSRIYGIDSNTILDAKLNLIFEIFSQNLYPNMTPFFEHLISTYSMTKTATCISQQNSEQTHTTQACTDDTDFAQQIQEIQALAQQLTSAINNNECNIDNSIYNNLPILIS